MLDIRAALDREKRKRVLEAVMVLKSLIIIRRTIEIEYLGVFSFSHKCTEYIQLDEGKKREQLYTYQS